MTNDNINILIASDINYAPYYGVMLTSLFMNNSGSSFDVHLITDNTWTEEETTKFKGLCSKYNSTFIVYAIDVEQMDSFPKHGHINRATYFNLNAANILPQDIHKVIYLDGDMIVRGDFSTLWQLDLEGKPCAMVEDCLEYDKSIYVRLGYSEKYGYYNNGIVVYNMDYLRQMKFPETAIRFIIENPEKAYWMDQDAINYFFADKTLRLPLKFNFQTWYLLKSHWVNYTKEYRKSVLEASVDPVVVHYIGGTKPWYFRYFGLAYYNEWKKYQDVSQWNIRGTKKPLNKYIKYIVKRYIIPSFMKKQIANSWQIDDKNKQFFFS